MRELSKHLCLDLKSVPKLVGTADAVVPCGQCPNCLKRKGSELAFRLYRQLRGRTVHMITFTYDNENCPIYRRESLVNLHTGELLEQFSSVIRWPDFFDKAPFEWKIGRKNKRFVRVKRFRPYSVSLDNDVFTPKDVVKIIDYYPTVYYKDLQDALKRFREKSDALTDYIAVPEYGSLGYRPHIHMLVCGFSQSDIDTLVSEWPFGDVDVRQVKDLKKDEFLIDGTSAVGNYVAKYATKGKFDCPYIRTGYCLKPRRAVSVDFGVGDSLDDLKPVFYRWDLYPGFNPLEKDFPQDYSSSELVPASFVADAFIMHRTVAINGYNYPLPKYLRDKLFSKKIKYYDETRQTFVRSLQACPLQKAITSVVFRRIVEDLYRTSGSCKRSCESSRFDFDKDYFEESFELQKSGYLVQSDDCGLSLLRCAEQTFLTSLENDSIY